MRKRRRLIDEKAKYECKYYTKKVGCQNSERKRKVTVYCGSIKYSLKSTSEILSHATETLQILENINGRLNRCADELMKI